MFKKILIVFFVSLPTVSAQEPTSKEDVIIGKLEELRKLITNIETGLRKELEEAKAKIIVLQDEVNLLKKELKPIKSPVPVPFPTPKTFNPPEEQYGKVKIINNYHTEMTVTVGEEKKVIKANEIIIFERISPPEFKYLVLGINKEPQTRPIKANEIFVITIGPK